MYDNMVIRNQKHICMMPSSVLSSMGHPVIDDLPVLLTLMRQYGEAISRSQYFSGWQIIYKAQEAKEQRLQHANQSAYLTT